LIEVFSQQIAVSNEARVQAEVRVAELATQLGFTREAVISFFQIVGEQDVPFEKVPLKLNEIAARHRDLLDRWSVLDTTDPVIANLAEEARQAIETGRYDEADSLLLRECEADIAAARQAEYIAQQAREAAERRLLRVAQSEEKRGDLAMTRLRYSDAAEHYAAAVGFVPAHLPDRRNSLLSRRANALFCHGCESGDNDALRHCVETFRVVLEGVPRERVPLQWAAIQNNLGNALWDLGKRESGTARLEEAVAAYRAALEVRTRDRAPLQWATTQMNLGNVLATLGKRECGTVCLGQAVAAYHAALQVMRRERTPLDWATTQNNLGSALLALGERECGTACLEEAVSSYRAALEVRTRDRAPLEWATTQNNLGNALTMLGERETGTAWLEEAVSAYRAALEVRTRDRVPLRWATTQNNLANALTTLGERENGTARLEEAISAYRAALQERTRDRVPLDWAMTQMNLGNALAVLSERANGTAYVEEALAAWNACLGVTASIWPLDWIEFVQTRRDELKSKLRPPTAAVASAPSATIIITF
jgi:tetratricopeptide (TPR) repeat protein